MLTPDLVIVDRCWGRAKTEAEAIERCRSNAARHPKRTTSVTDLAADCTEPDDTGDLCRPSDDPKPVLIRKGKAGNERPFD